MKSILNVGWTMVALILTACSVMPPAVERTALPPMNFEELIRDAEYHTGRMVVLGGYVVAVENNPDHTLVNALEVPLGFRREPGAKDLTRGRILLLYQGFLDPVVYTEGRKITVAGMILGSSATEPKSTPYPYLRVAVESLHLWPMEPPPPQDLYYRDPWRYSYPYPYSWWRRHPYWW